MILTSKKKQFTFILPNSLFGAIVLLTFFLLFSVNTFSQIPKTQSFTLNNIKLKEALKIIENKYNVHFAFDVDIIRNKKINISINNLTLEQCLVKLFREKNIKFDTISESVVLSKSSRSFYHNYSKRIAGNISDTEYLQPLFSASIMVQNTKTGTISDANGFFKLNATLVPDDTIAISYMGYKSIKIPISKFYNDSILNIQMVIDQKEISQIIIESEKIKKEQLFGMQTTGCNTIKLDNFSEIGGMADKDIFKITQLLPGISTSNEASTEISIRGGMKGQNQIIYDDIVMYHYGHFFGKVSAVNPGFADVITVFKESFPPEYSGHISGVIKINSSDTLKKNTEINIASNLMNAGTFIKKTLFNKKANLLLGFRTSINQYINGSYFNSFFEQNLQNSKITYDRQYVENNNLQDIVQLIPKHSFYDINAKLGFKINKRNNVGFSFIRNRDNTNYHFLIEDNYRYYERDSLNIQNTGLSIFWEKKWPYSFNSKLIFSSSSFFNNYTSLDTYNDSVIFHKITFSSIWDANARFIVNKNFNNQNFSLGYNYNYIGQNIDNDYLVSHGISSDTIHLKSSGISNNLLMSYRNTFFPKFDIYFASRLFYYNLTNKLYFEPRFYMIFKPHKFNLKYKLASGLYYQTINKIFQINSLCAEYYIWVLSRKDADKAMFSESKNFQYSLSALYDNKNFSASVSLFQKRITGIPSRILANELYNPYDETALNVSGFELLFQQNSKYLYNIISYTYLQTRLSIEKLSYFIPPDYDIPHQLKVLLGYKVKGFNLSVSYNFSSGMPYTPYDKIMPSIGPDSITYYDLSYKEFNSKRLDNYHRLDLTFSFKYSFKNIKTKIILAVINIFDHTNVLNRYYDIQYPDPYLNYSLEILQMDKKGLPRIYNVGLVLNWGK
jgi:hypothetical protein